MVRLGGGLDDDGRLDKRRRGARAGLSRAFRPAAARHACATACASSAPARCAWRAARSRSSERAREALGHPIEIISGTEEARLIYSGVAHTLPDEPGSRLVVDIGGGSTELIIGEGLEPLELESLKIGCVEHSARATSATAS